MTDRPLPLAGVRILSLEQYGAGPFGTLHLADLGAEIIKIEDPARGGDVGRSVPPFTGDHDSLFFQSLNRNKRSMELDLSSEAGRLVFTELVRHADGVFSNLRGDVPEKLGITYADLAPINPRIVCCSLSGFGMTGPRRADPAYDYVLQALCGWMSLTGEPDGVPTKSGLSLVDFTGGMAAALALVTGILTAHRTGVGMDCDVSLYDTSMSMLNYLATWQLTAGFVPERTRHSAHPTLVPFQNFPTADSWIVVACPNQKFWERLVQALGSPAWTTNPDFATVGGRSARAAEVIALVTAELSSRATDDWVAILSAAGVPCAPIRTMAEALDDEHTHARDLIVTVPHPEWGEVREVRTASRVGDVRRHHVAAPTGGADTDEILRAVCGYDDSKVAALRSSGAFGRRD
jgi:crotonobetainyl-CoA:carnitine CoA-transferase CaiB-like acyl-CoA transferase